MANATGEAKTGSLRLEFDRSVRLLFRGSAISSDGGLLVYRELDDALDQAATRSSAEPCRAPLLQLPLSSQELVKAAPHRG